jgi:diguanylate cyclase (GGDEF)-like protein
MRHRCGGERLRGLVCFVLLMAGVTCRGVCGTYLPPADGPGGYSDTIFGHLTQENGLASPVVTAIAQDGDGFLWLGTQSGLARWDGYHARMYEMRLGVSSTLPDDYIQTLYTDPHGRLWIGTNSGGLVGYDRGRDVFVRYLREGRDLGRLRVAAIVSDGAAGLWVGTDDGLDHLDIPSGVFTHIQNQGKGTAVLGGKRVLSLLRGPDGELWIGTQSGLFRSDAAKNNFVQVALPHAPDIMLAIQSLYRDSVGRLWVGTSHGAYVLDGQSGGARAVQETAAGESGLDNETVQTIAEVAPGVIWLGTLGHGIVAVDTRSFETHRIAHDPFLPTSLPENTTEALYRDRSGLVWVGTLRGASYADAGHAGIETFFGGSSRSGGISNPDVLSILPRSDGSTWVGTSGKGVELFDRSGRRTALLRGELAHQNPALGNESVTAIASTPDGTVYLGCKKSVYRADADSGHLARVTFEHGTAGGVDALLYDHGTLWLGTDYGLWRIDVSKGRSSTAIQAVLKEPLTSQRVTALQRGVGDDLWVGTENGLNRVDLATGNVERIAPDPASPTGLGAGLISSMLFDRSGRLWMSTFGGGIDVLEGRDEAGRPKFLRLIEGLPNANIDMLLEAPDGKIWASTDDGVASIEPDSFAIRAIRQPDGLAIQAYWTSAGAVAATGELMFGGIGGLTVIRPDLLRRWAYLPSVVVTDAQVGGKQVPVSEFNDASAGAPVEIVPTSNSLAVEFAALDYSAPQQNQYAYRLEGFDRDWIRTDPTRRLASYTNLPPGSYTLEMRGSNRDGVWGKTRQVAIRVRPAWYQTLLARIATVVLLVALLAGLFRISTEYLRLRQRELERQVALRTVELEKRTQELRESQRKLEQMAYSDSLTGLPNRRMFTEYFRRLLALKRRQRGSFVLITIDLDAFKLINDTYGHAAGDALLAEVAVRLNPMVRESDCFARVGGDEFAMLLAELGDAVGVMQVCEKILKSFAKPLEFQGTRLTTSMSIGVAMYPQGGESVDSLSKASDLALYRVKRRGGNGWHLHGSEVEQGEEELADESLNSAD